MRSRLPLPVVVLLIAAACGPQRREGRGDDDDSGAADDDDATGSDDDDAADDDATSSDDDDATDDDDDTSPPDPQAPQIVEVSVCQVTFSGNSFGLFHVDVIDPDGDMGAPLGYRLQIDDGALTTYEWDEPLGEAGTISHSQQIAQSDLPRGTTHEFKFTVRDDANHWSEEAAVVWTIPANPDIDEC